VAVSLYRPQRTMGATELAVQIASETKDWPQFLETCDPNHLVAVCCYSYCRCGRHRLKMMPPPSEDDDASIVVFIGQQTA
jgi:hypothetical protein